MVIEIGSEVGAYRRGCASVALAGLGQGMTEEPPVPVFTGAELALADTVILLMKVMSMHGIIDSAAIVTVFADMESRYRGQDLHTAAAMADYLRRHTTDADYDTPVRTLLDEIPGGSA